MHPVCHTRTNLRYGKLIQPREVLEKLSETTAEIALKQCVMTHSYPNLLPSDRTAATPDSALSCGLPT